jgi:uncharacterized protein (DUF433 family)
MEPQARRQTDIRRMRITVADVLGCRQRDDHPEIIEDFPELTEEDIGAFQHAADHRERRATTVVAPLKLLFDQNLKLCQRLDELFPGSAELRQTGEEDDGIIGARNGFIIVSQTDSRTPG